MEFEPTQVAGAWEFRPKVHSDARGVFLESFTQRGVESACGVRFDVAQINLSQSARNVVRGIHGAYEPPGQAKYVTCVDGEVLDVVVDLRLDSPTFGAWDSVVLSSWRRNAMLVSEGLGHGFQVLSDSATVVYATSTPYDPASEFTVNPLDDELDLPWRSHQGLVLSERDRDAQSLTAFRAGLLGGSPT